MELNQSESEDGERRRRFDDCRFSPNVDCLALCLASGLRCFFLDRFFELSDSLALLLELLVLVLELELELDELDESESESLSLDDDDELDELALCELFAEKLE